MTRIALVTCEEEPLMYEDDILLLSDLIEAGFEAVPVVWSDTSLDPSQFDILVIRSVWDYHERSEEFRHWLSSLNYMRVLNPLNVLRDNMDKSYLFQLSQRGIDIVPTLLLKAPPPFVDDLFEQLATDEIVLKPLLGASSHDLHRIRRGECFDLHAHQQRHPLGILVQPFYREVMERGEISLIFFNRKYSHSVRKMPIAGDFRVQDDYGGTFTYIVPPESLVAAAGEVIAQVEGDLLYARVDYLDTESQGFLLIELELLEPVLYIHDVCYRRGFIKALQELV